MAGTMHGGRLIAQLLKREGVQYLFTLSGGHIGAIFDGCVEEGIRIIDTRTSRRRCTWRMGGRGPPGSQGWWP